LASVPPAYRWSTIPDTVLQMRVVSFKGRPPGQDLLARFGKAGGTIGRSENNTLVLPDPERYISRVHASIALQGGGFVLIDNGTKNATLVNGQPIGQGNQARLSDGDIIRLGDYILAVTVNMADPFGDPVAASPYPTPLLPPDAGLIPRPREASIDADPWNARPQTIPSDRPPERHLPADALAGIRPSEPNVEDLFGLKSSRGADLLGPEPVRAGPATPAMPGSVDPLAYLTGAQKPTPPPAVPDHGPEIFSSYLPPAAKPDPAMGITAPNSASSGASKVPRSVESEELGRSRPAPWPPVGPQTDETLLRAFLKGAGIPDVQLPKGLTPESMEGLGRLLREAVHGTLDLLYARGLTKSEMRIDATRIMPTGNNPLKFAPTVEAALTQLLGPAVPGFMPPVRAMREAYDDLRAHQIGFLAGMRAALEDVLKRFEPEALEKRLVDPGLLRNLVPTNRKAKLWEVFLEHYRQIAGEAQEDFNTVFGRAFLIAYEAQVKELRARAPAARMPRDRDAQ
jgi:FHA domain-containing protein